MRVQAEIYSASAPDECAPTVFQRSSLKDPPYFKCVDSCRNRSHTQMIGRMQYLSYPPNGGKHDPLMCLAVAALYADRQCCAGGEDSLWSGADWSVCVPGRAIGPQRSLID